MFITSDTHLYTKPENMGFVRISSTKKSFSVNTECKSLVRSVVMDIRTEDEWKWPQLPDQGNLSKTRKK